MAWAVLVYSTPKFVNASFNKPFFGIIGVIAGSSGINEEIDNARTFF